MTGCYIFNDPVDRPPVELTAGPAGATCSLDHHTHAHKGRKKKLICQVLYWKSTKDFNVILTWILETSIFMTLQENEHLLDLNMIAVQTLLWPS